MAKNLTTSHLFREFAQIKSCTDEQRKLIDRLVVAVSERIANYCGRVFEATTYFAWVNGTGTNFLNLPNFPLINVWEVSLTSQSAFTAKFTGGSRASVSVHGGSIHLQSIHETTGVVTDTAIVLSSYKTVTLLIAQINTVSGWTATVYGSMGNQPAEAIKPLHAEWALDPNFAAIEVPDQVSSDDIAYNLETDGVLELEIGWDYLNSRRSLTVWPSGTNNLFIHYKAGYTLPVDDVAGESLTSNGDVPEDLTLTANTIIKAVYESTAQRVGALKSEKTKNYSYTMGDSAHAIIDKAIRDNRAGLLNHRSMKII